MGKASKGDDRTIILFVRSWRTVSVGYCQIYGRLLYRFVCEAKASLEQI